MPAQVALGVFSAFVLVLLWVERTESEGVSAALWIPTFWMMAIASKSLAMWVGLSGENESGSWPDQLLLGGLGLAAAAVVVKRHATWRTCLGQHPWILALLAYMLVSTSWSEIPLVALRRWTREVLVLVMALAVLSERDPRQAFASVLRRSAYILVPLSLLLVKYYRGMGVDYTPWSGEEMWVGVTPHKNTLGRLCLISAFFLLWSIYRRLRTPGFSHPWYRYIPDLVVLMTALFLLRGSERSYSATSVGTLAVGVVVLLALTSVKSIRLTSIRRPLLLALFVGSISTGILAPFVGGANLGSASSMFGRDATLTGRTETWAELVPQFMRNPVIGSGFASFWTTTRRDQYRMSHGHNGYLDTLLELGTVGLLLLVAWMLSSARRLFALLASDRSWASFALGFLFMAATYNTTESTLNSLAEQMSAVMVMAVLVVTNERQVTGVGSHLGLRVHVSPQRTSRASPPELGSAADGSAVHLLRSRRRQ